MDESGIIFWLTTADFRLVETTNLVLAVPGMFYFIILSGAMYRGRTFVRL